MIDFQTGLQSIVEGQGVPIAIAGMAIVFSSLAIIASFITILPHLLRWVTTVVPESTPQLPRPNGEDGAALAAAAAAAYHAASTGAA